MEFRKFAPSDRLRPYIRHYYLFAADAHTAFEDIVFPSGDMEMIFNLGEGIWEASVKNEFLKTPPAELWGQITRPMPIRSIGKHTMLGIKFFPHSAAYFIDGDIAQFNDQVSDLAAVIGTPVRTLHRQLVETAGLVDRLDLIDAFLSATLARNQKRSGSIQKVGNLLSSIKKSSTGENLSRVAADHNITPRYLQKLIYQHTGLSPKIYNKITRFQLSLQLIGRNDQPLTSIAYECGYFDQSHFIRDFKHFTGRTPSAYRDQITPVNQLLSC
jgi:AraC-like DNA-binding protein